MLSGPAGCFREMPLQLTSGASAPGNASPPLSDLSDERAAATESRLGLAHLVRDVQRPAHTRATHIACKLKYITRRNSRWKPNRRLPREGPRSGC